MNAGRKLDSLGLLKDDDRGDKSSLRLSLLWNELRDKASETPTAVLGLLDIVNSQNRERTQAAFAHIVPLGTGNVANYFREFRPFEEARAFIQGLGLKSKDEWEAYCVSGKRPADIPSNPQATYEKAGWSGWGDWFSTGRIANQNRQYRPFEKPAHSRAVSV